MRQFFKVSAFILNFTALLAVIWIIIPAPAYQIWLFSVAVSEWSLWISAVVLVGILSSLFFYAFSEKRKLQFAALIVGSIALIISLYPLLSVISIAQKRNVSFSLKQYFSALWGENNFLDTKSKAYKTYTFAQVDGQQLQMDVYLPTVKSAENGASVIVLHGGSWNAGVRSDFPQWNQWLAAQGFTVFDIDYRLAPQPNYLSAVGDVKCAVHWIKKHSAEFDIAPERIAVLGRSAGAHLALLAAYSATDIRLPSTCAKNEITEDVSAVISFYAPTALLWAYDNPANTFVIDGPATLSSFLGGSPYESQEIRERYILASPTTHVSSNTPPTLLIHGGQDQLIRNENMNFLADKLKEVNAPHKTLYIPYAQHGFDYNFNGWGAQLAQSEIIDFLRKNTRAR